MNQKHVTESEHARKNPPFGRNGASFGWASPAWQPGKGARRKRRFAKSCNQQLSEHIDSDKTISASREVVISHTDDGIATLDISDANVFGQTNSIQRSMSSYRRRRGESHPKAL